MELGLHIATFVGALALVMYGAKMGTVHATHLARIFGLSRYTVGFLVVAVISILPETFIALNASFDGIPEFGLGTLFGSNVADLTLVFAITLFVAGRGLSVESSILKHNRVYPWVLLIPLVLGLDGYFSRIEGLTLMLVGGLFYFLAFRSGHRESEGAHSRHALHKTVFLLLVSMVTLLVGAHFTVTSGVAIASVLGVSPVLVGVLIVGLGTTIPELFFAIRSTRSHEDSLALGDVLGTVLADATIVVGILALVNPFSFPTSIIYVAGAFMVASAFVLFNFMKTGHTLSRKEGIVLTIFWILFVAIEFILARG